VKKLTPEQCADIRRRAAQGEKVADLAAEYRVHRTTISKAKLGKY